MSRTQERILDAAEGLFALQGIGATSLRSITAAAGVNAAAIHYHFGSKRLLVEAILKQRIAPIQRARLALLDQLEATHPGDRIPAESLVEAFVLPLIPSGADPRSDRAGYDRLVAWLRVETEGALVEVAPPVGIVSRRFARALCRGRALGLEEAEARFQLATGALVQFLRRERIRSEASTGAAESSDAQDGAELHRRLYGLLRFVTGGIDAPSPAEGTATGAGTADLQLRHASSPAVRLVETSIDSARAMRDGGALRVTGDRAAPGSTPRPANEPAPGEVAREEGSPR